MNKNDLIKVVLCTITTVILVLEYAVLNLEMAFSLAIISAIISCIIYITTFSKYAIQVEYEWEEK